ncbi:4a-hydroxytetrahydrobiopterin dehydratase [Kibdelosporangium phytohabitans]|uniref:Putative pterin-4-alpha-carbinolamine dehydratase n=1 Tax=Kibdelosporangium phytohabitans TaxID=860235 RepID=A0A0N9HX30_9PSEU|nr:4a-hydroxytetrahydrobiopterin dehydratase [Kibdelosporangium phytohabitans]ALG06621.1 pterin-4-alpha-carbinolamine dehydratase [Kibdelosporangium phytohabitans]MBE1467828.1 4a-hydroxytetrahydrobiopterin dehydratase [Kibdelosporangium phytohabitans]
MAELLTDDELTSALEHLPSWRRDGSAIVRTVELDSFPQAIQVVNRIAEIAENDDHHPDIDIRWRTLTFALSTHSAGGLTAKDTALATEIDSVIETVRPQE